MAILSAGAVFGSVTDFIAPGHHAKDLKKRWNSFCSQNNGYPLLAGTTDIKSIETCKGHFPKTGKMVFFSQENLLAQPTWIYWGENKVQPMDVIITFYHNDQEQTKAFRINRFELEALTELSAGATESNVMANLKETISKRSLNSKKDFIAKTIIGKGKEAKITAIHSTNKITIDSKLIYNT